MRHIAKELLGIEVEDIGTEPARLERLLKQDNNRETHLQEVLAAHEVTAKDLSNAVTTGFDIATRAGPLFDEAVMGAVFIVESIDLVKEPVVRTPQQTTSP